MAKFKKEPHTRGAYSFRCPGCNSKHIVFTTNEGYQHSIWDFNWDLEKPTIIQSIRIVGSYPDGLHICHSFIKNGMIQFLPDCTHALAGQTVELPEI